jgi:hypothetical protein
MKKKRLPFFLCVACGLATAASAAEMNLKLPGVSEDALLTLRSNNPIGDGRLCIAGEVFDPDDAKSAAVGLVVNVKTSTIEWAKTLPPITGMFQNRFVGCYGQGEELHFVEETDTQSPATLRQVLLHSVRFADNKRAHRTALWQTGKSNWLVALNKTPTSSFAILGHASEEAEGQAQMTIHELASPPKYATIRHGSFQSGAVAVKDGDRIQIAGRFSKSGFDTDAAPAAALLTNTGSYVWSKPLEGDPLFGKSTNLKKIVTASAAGENSDVVLRPLVQSAVAGQTVQRPSATCKSIAVFADFAVAFQACQPDTITFQYTDGRASKVVSGTWQQVVPGPTALAAYDRVAKGKSGYRMELVNP